MQESCDEMDYCGRAIAATALRLRTFTLFLGVMLRNKGCAFVGFLDELCSLEKSAGPLNPTLAPLFAHEAALSQFAQYLAGK
jgi:hypothetical protein